MTNDYNPHAAKDKAYQDYLRNVNAATWRLRDKEYGDPLKWSIGDLRREKRGYFKKIRELQHVIISINKALDKRGYVREVKGGGC